jgi:hypothetical protein
MKGRIARKTGGPAKGENQMAQDMSMKNQKYTYQSKVDDEAEERKRGGKAMGKVKGAKAKADMGRAPRKSGGRTGSNMNPLSSAAKGTSAPGRDISGSLT